MRLDHLLSKEHLQLSHHGRMLVVGVVRSKGPLHGRSFRGGCSWVEYQQIAAVSSCASSLVRTLVVLERWGAGGDGLVFGTLLGPETTGPCGGSPFVGVAGWVCLFLVSLP